MESFVETGPHSGRDTCRVCSAIWLFCQFWLSCRFCKSDGGSRLREDVACLHDIVGLVT